MDIEIVAALGQNREIGLYNRLPWNRIPTDMERFRRLTTGYPIIMGRKTFESIGRPLPKRVNIILSRSMMQRKSVYVATSLEVAISIAEDLGYGKAFIIGGQQIFEESLDTYRLRGMHLTYIDAYFEADTYFPMFDKSDWELVESYHTADNPRDPYETAYYHYIRK